MFKIKIFADGADLEGIKVMTKNPHISGFTTNPTLMKKAGVSDYEKFAKQALDIVEDKPISFEVFADDNVSMIKQGLKIASWGTNISVKIPVTDTKGKYADEVMKELSNAGVKLNITAVMTTDQVKRIVDNINSNTSGIISVFAGRIADTGLDPIPIMKESLNIMGVNNKLELIWASPRELLNIFQAQDIGCHIITATNDIIDKIKNVGKDLNEFSIETVKMFHNDSISAGFNIKT